jgi:hypothetical protein
LFVLSEIILDLDLVILFILFALDIIFELPIKQDEKGDIIFFFMILKFDFFFIDDIFILFF